MTTELGFDCIKKNFTIELNSNKRTMGIPYMHVKINIKF